MRFAIVQGVVLNVEAIDMIVPQGEQANVFLRGGSARLLNLNVDDLMQHPHHEGDDAIVRVLSNHEHVDAEGREVEGEPQK
jgi:hypothetical protein